MAMRLYGFGTHSNHPLNQVQLMGTLIKEYAAAFAVPSCTPTTRIIIGLCAIPIGDNPIHPFHVTNSARNNNFTHLSIQAIRALIKHHCKQRLRFIRHCIHFFDLFCINTRRLFANRRNTFLQCLNYQSRMIIVRNSHYNCVNVRFFNELFTRRIAYNIAVRVRFFDFVSFQFANIGNRCYDCVFNATVHKEFQVARTHIANTNNTVLYRFHTFSKPPVTSL